jgi:hypothetical protein
MKTVSVIALAMLATVAVIAQSGMRPGQWETTTQMQMPNMPAGVQMPSIPASTCITPKWRRTPRVQYLASPAAAVATKTTARQPLRKRRGNTFTYTIACTSPEKVSGTGEMTFAGDDSYTNTLKMVMAQGEITMKTTGKRVGDCTDDNPAAAAVCRSSAPLQILTS